MKDWSDIKIKEQLRKRYSSFVPSLMKIAQSCGYALAVHGSMERDLDLIAVPWVPNAMTSETLVMRLEEAMRGHAHVRAYWKERVENKPHGRKGYAIVFATLSEDFENPNHRHAYMDLSVMPRK